MRLNRKETASIGDDGGLFTVIRNFKNVLISRSSTNQSIGFIDPLHEMGANGKNDIFEMHLSANFVDDRFNE